MEKLFNAIAPYDCLVCGQEGSLLCAWCRPDACPAVVSRCYLCQKQTVDFATCPKCRRKGPLKHVWVCGMYEQVPKELVRSLKYQYRRPAASLMAQYMAGRLPYLETALIVPVPTARLRVRVRGFDQAELIAQALAAQCGLSYKRTLHRHGITRQVGAKRLVRMAQLTEAFTVYKPHEIQGKRLLLVDDVVTTGATLQVAAQALRTAGAREVSAIVFAQAI